MTGKLKAKVKAPEPREAGGPRSLTRLLALFDALSAVHDGHTLAELSGLLASPKSSLLNLLRPLVAEGFLTHNAGVYRLGPAIFFLASEVLDAWYIPQVMHPLMEQLARQSGESVMLSVIDIEKALLIYVDIVNSPHPIRYQIAVGTVRPLYASTAGRVLLGHADRSWRQQYLASLEFGVQLVRPFTRASLRREVEQIRELGIGWAVDVYAEGLSAVAAPLIGDSGRCVACLNIAGPTERFCNDLPRLKGMVKAAAEKGSRALAAVEASPARMAAVHGGSSRAR